VGDLPSRPNLARRRFLQREEVLTTGHEDFAEIAVARLRAAADRYPRDRRLAALLAELRAGSEEFATIWDARPVRVPGHRTKTMLHPRVGPLRVHCDVLPIPDDDQQVVFITADPGSPGARGLRRLAAGLTAGGIRALPAGPVAPAWAGAELRQPAEAGRQREQRGEAGRDDHVPEGGDKGEQDTESDPDQQPPDRHARQRLARP
jgi:hypothetical protein